MYQITTIMNQEHNDENSVNIPGVRANTDEIFFSNICFDDFFNWSEKDGFKIADSIVYCINNNINVYQCPLPKITKFTLVSNSLLVFNHKFIIFKASFTKIKRITFSDCKFVYRPDIIDNKIWKIEFNNCEFQESDNFAKNLLEDNGEYKKRVIFNNCDFMSFNIGDITDIQYNLDIKLCRFYLSGGRINHLKIENIELATKFYINKQYDGDDKVTTIDELTIQNTIFKENFKLHNCHVDKVLIKDTDFEKNANFYKSEFKQRLNEDENNIDNTIYFNSLNFRSLALFGDCIFYNKCSFKYVTFEGHSHFRGAKFKKGLDLDYTNIQKEMNFFDVKELDTSESKKNTSQETYRILKYNFQRIGNQIEANKYHSLELDIHRQRTWDKILKRDFITRFSTETSRALELLSDGLVSLFHYISSNHSRTWIVPIFWIFIVGFFTNICMDCDKENFEYINMFKYISIANFDECLKKHYIIFFLNKISLGYLYYQFIIATRKNTKK